MSSEDPSHTRRHGSPASTGTLHSRSSAFTSLWLKDRLQLLALSSSALPQPAPVWVLQAVSPFSQFQRLTLRQSSPCHPQPGSGQGWVPPWSFLSPSPWGAEPQPVPLHPQLSQTQLCAPWDLLVCAPCYLTGISHRSCLFWLLLLNKTCPWPFSCPVADGRRIARILPTYGSFREDLVSCSGIIEEFISSASRLQAGLLTYCVNCCRETIYLRGLLERRGELIAELKCLPGARCRLLTGSSTLLGKAQWEPETNWQMQRMGLNRRKNCSREADTPVSEEPAFREAQVSLAEAAGLGR